MNTFDIILGIVILGVVGFLIFKFKDKIRRGLQQRIEENSVVIPNLTYGDRKGKEHTEDIVVKRSLIPLVGDWARIYPPVDEYGKPNWVNIIFGGKKNLIKLVIMLFIITMMLLAFFDIFTQYEILKTACEPYLNKIAP